jgi:hypothetical protein
MLYALYVCYSQHYIITVLRIYTCCNNLYAHCFPQAHRVWSSATQTFDGVLRVRVPGFRTSALPVIGRDPDGSTGVQET